jgi:hypothetical protein
MFIKIKNMCGKVKIKDEYVFYEEAKLVHLN